MPKVVMYSTEYCPFCKRAKMLLDQKGVQYKTFDVMEQPELKAEMVKLSNGRTSVPQIFIGQTHVGGCDDLFALEAAKKLDGLLAS